MSEEPFPEGADAPAIPPVPAPPPVVQYVVFDASGAILRAGTCLRTEVPAQAGGDLDLIAAEIDPPVGFAELRRLDATHRVEDGALVAKPDVPLSAEALDRLKAGLCEQVDRQAGAIRQLHVTDIAAQDAVYLQKRREAELVAADPDTDPVLVPHIAAGARVNGHSLGEEAALVLATSAAWTALSGRIEEKRLGAKAAIRAAADEAAARAAALVDWQEIL